MSLHVNSDRFLECQPSSISFTVQPITNIYQKKKMCLRKTSILTRRRGFVRSLMVAKNVHVGFAEHVPLPFAIGGEASPPWATSTIVTTSTASRAASRRLVRKVRNCAIILSTYKYRVLAINTADRFTATGALNFSDESAGLMAGNVWNEEKKVICGPLDGIMPHGEQCGSWVGIYDLTAVISSRSHFFCFSKRASLCGILHSNTCICMSPM